MGEKGEEGGREGGRREKGVRGRKLPRGNTPCPSQDALTPCSHCRI